MNEKNKTFNETFLEVARPVMKFLVDDYGFEETEIRLSKDSDMAHAVCWIAYYREINKGESLFVDLSIAPFRLESSIDLAKGKFVRENRIYINELHSIIDGGVFPPRTVDLYKAISDPGLMRIEFERLTKVLRECGERFFQNDNSLWIEIERHRKQIRENEEQHKVSLEAETAFKDENWSKTIELLNQLGNRITKLQKARLSYALKKIKNG